MLVPPARLLLKEGLRQGLRGIGRAWRSLRWAPPEFQRNLVDWRQGGPSPKAAEKEETPRSKAALIALLKESATFCNPLVNAMTDEGMVQLMKVGPNEGARGLVLTGLITHGNEMYGTIAVYLRLKGIVPPTTARQQPAPTRGN